ncbi:MAG: PAS domain-containing protein [Rhodospirillaceae bacterium]|nr:PAS domain-containing protein [Rhodospirillaceae bacterium]
MGERGQYQRIIGPGFLEVCTPRIKRAYEYWDSKRNGRSMPSRAYIDPNEIRQGRQGACLRRDARFRHGDLRPRRRARRRGLRPGTLGRTQPPIGRGRLRRHAALQRRQGCQ